MSPITDIYTADAFRTDLGEQVREHFDRYEKELRFTTFKSDQSVLEMLNLARRQACELALSRAAELDILDQVRKRSALGVKNDIARALAGMWPDKYEARSSFFQLVENHQALAEAIYTGWLAASLEPGGNLQPPPDAPAKIRKPGIRANLTRDIMLRDTLGNEVGFRKGERCVLQESDGKAFVQKIVRKKDAPPGQDEYELWPHTFLLPDRRLVQEVGPRPLAPEEPLLQSPVSADEIRPAKAENAWLKAAWYALARNAPAWIHETLKEQEDKVWVRLFELHPKTGSFQPLWLPLEKTLPAAEGSDAVWTQWLEKAYATYKGSYEALREGDIRLLLSSFLGRRIRPVPVSRISTTDWKLDQLLSDLPDYLMHEALSKHLRTQAGKYGLTESQLARIECLQSPEIADFRTLVLGTEPEVWAAWTQCQQERIQLDLEFEQQDQAIKAQFAAHAETLRARRDITPSQLKNEQGKMSMALDGRLKKLRSDFKARRAQLDVKANEEAKRAESLETELKRMSATASRRAGLEALLKTSMSFMKLKYRQAIFLEDFETIVAELAKFCQSNPEIKFGTTGFRTADLLSILKALGQGQFPSRSEGESDPSLAYSHNQQALFEQIADALEQGQIILAGNEARSDSLPMSTQFVYPIVDTLDHQGRKCVRVAHPLDQEFSRFYKLTEGKLSPRAASQDFSRSTVDPRAGTYIPEFWIDLKDLGSYFSSLYMTY
ncbi:MAG TPA: hypothetical protein V6D23_07435 [Candidatus Obscuribacterales bacterium]